LGEGEEAESKKEMGVKTLDVLSIEGLRISDVK
jgi:hypothetical protein